MCDNFNKSVLKLSVAQICLSMGWHSMQKSTHAILTDVLERYLGKLTKTTASYCENFSRTIPNVNDVSLAFNDLGIPFDELKDYVTQVDAVSCRDKLPAYPVQKSSIIVDLPSQEELLTRDGQYDDHFPALSTVCQTETEVNSSKDDDKQNLSNESSDTYKYPEERTVSPLKLPLVRKRSAASPPYSPVEPKRLNVDINCHPLDLTRPDLKVSTPIGLAPIVATAEPAASSVANNISTDAKQHPQPQAISPLSPPHVVLTKQKKTSPSQLISSPDSKVKSPVKKSHSPITSKLTPSNDVDKRSLTLHLLKPANQTKSKSSIKAKSPDCKLISPKKKMASPAKHSAKNTPSNKPPQSIADLSFKSDSSFRDVLSPRLETDSPNQSETITVAKGLPHQNEILLSPEGKSKSVKVPEIMSPPTTQKSTRDRPIKNKKKKQNKEIASVSMTNLLFSDPLPMVSTAIKKSSPSDQSDHSAKISIKSMSPIKSPSSKTESASSSVSAKKKKKKTKEKESDAGKKHLSIGDGKKIKKEKLKDEAGKPIPKLTLKMAGVSSQEAETGQTPKLIIKSECSPPAKPSKPSTCISTVPRAPSLPTSKIEKIVEDTQPRGVFMETLTTTLNPANTDVYYCPTCNLPDNGSPMIGCDGCDQWFHWPCVSVFVAPKDDESWYCPGCAQKQTKKKKKRKKKDD